MEVKQEDEENGSLSLMWAILLARLPNLHISALADVNLKGKINFLKSKTVGETFTARLRFTGKNPQIKFAGYGFTRQNPNNFNSNFDDELCIIRDMLNARRATSDIHQNTGWLDFF